MNEWRALKASPGGSRFNTRFDAHQGRSFLIRLVLSTIGAVFVLAGLLMLVFPGPGLLFILLGLSLGSLVFRPMARLLDAIERLGLWAWRKVPARLRASRAVRIAFVMCGLLGATAAAIAGLWLARTYVLPHL